MISTIKVVNLKVVELITIYNFYFGHVFMCQSISKHCSQIHIWLIVSWTIREACWFVNNVYYHFVRWRNNQNKSCRSWWVIQLWYSSLFSWNHLMVENLVRTCHFFKFKILKCSNFDKWNFIVIEWMFKYSHLDVAKGSLTHMQ